ncbi:methionine--tRNA ligase [Pseudemcibacter aquimaris]|uniref:methionine--tRNA ligase n=1 Tax=Pseudemcibacter aquimaris TaxID=2857064 RepID=UPI002011440F|nr:methionine--tRNA ligase [Pseudemcibacter aquimaris]MCC3860984.1 methionine--tRNA ligase [Pseudemcibacter aquimaris]WDU59802.1 methionine--tRNA ligase [Pseudemcibacter aquimaris]
MSSNDAFYITTPIYYVNDIPHIGHAYTTLACDFMARFKRLDGYDVMFLTGTDEHGQKVEKSAEAAGKTPIEFCDQVSQRFRELAEFMNFSNDDFIRTTEERHIKACQALWTKLEENGHIYLDKYAGWYSVRDEAFYGEKELIEGDDGEKLAPTGAPVEWVEEESYFFKLSAFEDKLLEFYESIDPTVLPKSRKNEVKSFVEGGLRDLSVSRTSFKWGVPVPGNDKHIMYVWIDALTNYMTAVGYPDMDSDSFQKFWPADIHMVGKDILRFHAVYWPAFLMGAGIEPGKRVFAHGWWTNEGQKISKSLGNVIDPFQIVEEFGLDQVRYFLMREVPFGNDGDFNKQAMINRINSDLANDLGNLAQRSLSMIFKNCDGAMPTPGDLNDNDKAILADLDALLPKVREFMDVQAFNKALETIWKVVSDANGYFAGEEPWALKKTDPDRMGTVLYTTAEIIRQIGIIIQPIMPDSAAKLLDLLKIPADERGFDKLGSDHRLPSGTAMDKPEGVFPRYVADKE